MVPSPYDPEHAADFVGERSLSRWRERSAHHLRSRQRLTICHLGACGLVQVYLFNLVVHVGCWVAPWAIGNAVARKGSKLLMDCAGLEVGSESSNSTSSRRIACHVQLQRFP